MGCEPGDFGSEPKAWLEFVLAEDVEAERECSIRSQTKSGSEAGEAILRRTLVSAKQA